MIRCCIILFLVGCSAFPAEETQESTVTFKDGEVYTAIVDFEHADIPKTLDARDFAEISWMTTNAWLNHEELKNSNRVKNCVRNSYHIIADRKTFNNLCDSGNNINGCSYTRRNLRLGERINSPFNNANVYTEDYYSDCINMVYVIVHETLHSLVECHRDKLINDRGDVDHSREWIWINSSEEDSLEYLVGEDFLNSSLNENCEW